MSALTIASSSAAFIAAITLSACSADHQSNNQFCDANREGWLNLDNPDIFFHLYPEAFLTPSEGKIHWHMPSYEKDGSLLSLAESRTILGEFKQLSPHVAVIVVLENGADCQSVESLQLLVDQELHCKNGYPCGFMRSPEGAGQAK